MDPQRDTYPKIKYGSTPFNFKEINSLPDSRIKATIKLKEDIIFNKQAEISRLRQEKTLLMDFIRSMVKTLTSVRVSHYLAGNLPKRIRQ